MSWSCVPCCPPAVPLQFPVLTPKAHSASMRWVATASPGASQVITLLGCSVGPLLLLPPLPSGRFGGRARPGADCRRGFCRLPAVAVGRGAHHCGGPGLARAGILAGRAVQVVRLAPPQAGLDSGHGAGRLGPRCTGAPGIDRRHVPVSGDAGANGPACCKLVLPSAARFSNERSATDASWPMPWARIRPARSCPRRPAGAPSCACRKS